MFLILILKLSIMRKLLLVSFFCTASAVVSLAQLKVLPNGNVGIGTTSPGYQLTLGGTNGIFGIANTAYFLAKNSTGTYESYLWL